MQASHQLSPSFVTELWQVPSWEVGPQIRARRGVYIPLGALGLPLPPVPFPTPQYRAASGASLLTDLGWRREGH